MRPMVWPVAPQSRMTMPATAITPPMAGPRPGTGTAVAPRETASVARRRPAMLPSAPPAAPITRPMPKPLLAPAAAPAPA